MNTPAPITQWLREKLGEHRWVGVIEPRTVSHEWRKHTGGRTMRAGLTVSISPADVFSVSFPSDAASAKYVAAVRNGLFSVLLGHTFCPVLKCAVSFESFAIHEIDACYAAFFMASKEATERLLGLGPDQKQNIAW